MHGEDRIDQVASKGPKPCEDAIFVRASESRVADDVSYEDRRELPGLAHGASAEGGRSPVALALAWLHFHAALRTRGQPEVQSGVQAETLRPRRAEISTGRVTMAYFLDRAVVERAWSSRCWPKGAPPTPSAAYGSRPAKPLKVVKSQLRPRSEAV